MRWPAPTRSPWSRTLPAPTSAPGPTTARLWSSQPRAEPASSPTIEPTTLAPAPTCVRAPDDGVLDDTALGERRARAEDGEASEPRAVLDDRTRADVDGRDELRVGMHVGRLVDEREVGAERVSHLGLEDPLEHVAVRLEVRLRRPDVEPVARKRDPVHGALRRELREHLALDRDGPAGRHEVEHLGLEDVEARR